MISSKNDRYRNIDTTMSPLRHQGNMFNPDEQRRSAAIENTFGNAEITAQFSFGQDQQ